jgi:hypothetical protein
MPLDTRPIPRYALGFPPAFQENLIATVERELENLTKDGKVRREVAEDYIETQLKYLRRLCKNTKVQNMGSFSFQPRLSDYILALGVVEANS